MTHGFKRRTTLIAALAAFATAPLFAAQGDSVQANGQFVDQESGITVNFFLNANQTDNGSRGNPTVGVFGPGLGLCTTHGPGPDFGSPANNFTGNFPLANVQCGGAGNQTVKIDGCVANIEAHGFVHSDHPNVNFMGATTVDVRYQKTREGDQVKVTIYTPKEKILLSGKVAGSSMMSSCP
jgi:hypothetical protein